MKITSDGLGAYAEEPVASEKCLGKGYCANSTLLTSSDSDSVTVTAGFRPTDFG